MISNNYNEMSSTSQIMVILTQLMKNSTKNVVVFFIQFIANSNL